MSKYIKNLVSDHVRKKLEGVQDALLVNVIGLTSNQGMKLRSELQAKNIRLLVVKNSLAARAVAGTSLAPMFEGVNGSMAICWGSEDIVSLAKEITKIIDSKSYEKFEARGGVMDGAQLTAAQVKEVSKWPSRTEQLSILAGQILGPGSKLASQLIGPGGALASQIKQKGEETESAAEPAAQSA